jgi:type IV secretory pathway VirB2 component (pilin)
VAGVFCFRNNHLNYFINFLKKPMRLSTSSIVALIVAGLGIVLVATQPFGRMGSYVVAAIIFFLARAISVYKWLD